MRTCHERGHRDRRRLQRRRPRSRPRPPRRRRGRDRPAPARESYLVIDKIIDAAGEGRRDAVHPGYGFLSENEDFAEACEAPGITFIGPPAERDAQDGQQDGRARVMARAACRSSRRQRPRAARLPDEARRSPRRAIGFPVMLKAAAGGGGKGMRLVATEASSRAWEARAARRRRVRRRHGLPREGDHQAAPRRDPGARRRARQRRPPRRARLLDPAPPPEGRRGDAVARGAAPRARARMGAARSQAARAVGYVGAGTFEFLLGADGASTSSR
jgi:biotin carboxylase